MSDTTDVITLQQRVNDLEAQVADQASTVRRLQIENGALRDANIAAVTELNEANSRIAALTAPAEPAEPQ